MADTGKQAASAALMHREAAADLTRFTRESARKVCDFILMFLSALHFFGWHWLRQCVAFVVEIV